jgi:hypothetical protein
LGVCVAPAASVTSGPDSGESGADVVRRIGSGRAGPVRVKLRRAVAEARAAGRVTAEHEVRALLAERYAAIVDAAAAAGDGPGLLRAGDKLVELLDTLPIRAGGESIDSGGDGRGKLLRVLDSPAEVGNSSHD